MKKIICVYFLDTYVTYNGDPVEYYNLLRFLTAANFEFEVEYWDEDHDVKEVEE